MRLGLRKFFEDKDEDEVGVKGVHKPADEAEGLIARMWTRTSEDGVMGAHKPADDADGLIARTRRMTGREYWSFGFQDWNVVLKGRIVSWGERGSEDEGRGREAFDDEAVGYGFLLEST